MNATGLGIDILANQNVFDIKDDLPTKLTQQLLQ
jgi:hypothetical protein